MKEIFPDYKEERAESQMPSLKNVSITTDRLKLEPIKEVWTRVIFEEFNDEVTLYMVPKPSGQQSAYMGLLGARVTVLDICPEQLEMDRHVCSQYGLNVEIMQGDMRDLTGFPRESFDIVYQPISSLFIPDLDQLFAQVASIIKPLGIYSCQYAYPLLLMAENHGWKDNGIWLKITQPYVSGAILENQGKLNFSKGESFSEFHHLLSDIINGLISNEFSLLKFLEDPRPERVKNEMSTAPETKDQNMYLPFGITTISRKRDVHI